MAASTSSTMATRSKTLRSLDEVPKDAIRNIMVLLARNSSVDVFKVKRVSKTFKECCEIVEVYKNMEIDSLTTGRFWGKRGQWLVMEKCRAQGNPNIKFVDGMNKFFYLRDDAGKQMLEEASSEGQRDATFALGMLMLAEGQRMKKQALQSLNEAFPCSSPRTKIVKQTMRKVERLLVRDTRREIRFHGIRCTCTKHQSGWVQAFLRGNKWLFECDVCLWETCFMRFAKIFGKNYGGWL